MISKQKSKHRTVVYTSRGVGIDSFALLAAILQAIPELFRASKETSSVSIATDQVSRPC